MENSNLFNKYLSGQHWKNHTTEYAERFLDFLIINNFKGILVDVGCGSGRDTNFFASKISEFQVIGMDCDFLEISLARENHPENVFLKRNIECCDFLDSSVGAFFMINVIHYVDQKKALSEIIRILEPNGYLFVHFNLEIIDVHGNVDYFQNKEEIFSLISGFKIRQAREIERVDYSPIEHVHKILELVLQK